MTVVWRSTFAPDSRQSMFRRLVIASMGKLRHEVDRPWRGFSTSCASREIAAVGVCVLLSMQRNFQNVFKWPLSALTFLVWCSFTVGSLASLPCIQFHSSKPPEGIKMTGEKVPSLRRTCAGSDQTFAPSYSRSGAELLTAVCQTDVATRVCV